MYDEDIGDELMFYVDRWLALDKIKRALWRNTREREFKPKKTKGCPFKERLQNMKEKNETLVQFLFSKEVKAYQLKIMQGKQASNLYTIFTWLSQRAKRAIKHSGFCPFDDDEQ
ncbi:hypothetical protein MAR_021668, partial [Mya arenaria]